MEHRWSSKVVDAFFSFTLWDTSSVILGIWASQARFPGMQEKRDLDVTSSVSYSADIGRLAFLRT
jgi:hypothetical protein